MKKLLCLLLALLMLLSSAALAESVPVDESAHLTREELEIYLDSLAAAAREEGNTAVSRYDDVGPVVAFSGGALIISDEEFSDTTAILRAFLDEHQADPRGLYIGSKLEEVLTAYPNDNPSLSGSYFDAALYINGEKPEITVGYLLRYGQNVLGADYLIFTWGPDGVAVSGVSYTFDQGYVSYITVYADELTEETTALEYVQEVADMQEISEFTPVPMRADKGESLAPFEREDLTITQCGVKVADFLDLTAEDLIAALGNPPVNEWAEDSDGSFLRLMQWDGVSLLLKYDGQKRFVSVDSLTINDYGVEGPRYVTVGDALDSVIFRFRHGETFVSGDTLSLYGDGQAAPYGMLAYSPESAELSYAFSLEDGRTVVWHMTFVIGELQSMTLMLR